MLISDDKDIEEQRRRSAERGGNGILQGPVEDGPVKGKWVGPGSAEWETVRHVPLVALKAQPASVLPGHVTWVSPDLAAMLRDLADRARLTVAERETLLKAAGIIEVLPND